jgi:hypothetical protein
MIERYLVGALCVTLCAGCSKPAPKAVAAEPLTGAAAPVHPALMDPNAAIFVRGGQILAVDAAGKQLESWPQPEVVWCATDARIGAVWTMTADESGRATLWMQMLVPDARPVKIAAELPSVPVEIVYPDGKRVALLDDADYDVAVQLKLGEQAQLEPIVGCGNAMSVDICYTYGPDGMPARGPDGKEQLSEELEGQRAQIRAAKLTNPTLLAELAARGGARPIWRSEAPKPAPRLGGSELWGVECSGAEECGEAVELTHTPYHLVVTTSSWGDLPHNERQVYDPALKGFISPASPTAHQPGPLTDEAAIFPDARLRVSPNGKSMLDYGALRTFGVGKVFGDDDTMACGFVGAGALIPQR